MSIFVSGPNGAEGAQGPAGPAGAGSLLEYTLDGNTAATDTQFNVTATAGLPVQVGSFLVIDAYTSQAEVRKVVAASGTQITVAALTYAHADGDMVLVLNGEFALARMWNAKGDNSTDDQAALQEAIRQTSPWGLWLDGEGKTYEIRSPLVTPSGTKIRNLNLSADGSYAPAETNNAMIMTQSGNILTFTGEADDDVITTSSSHGIPADDIGVVFQGSSLPTGITAGKLYYARDRTATTFKVSETAGGAAVNLTADGSGTVYGEVYASNARVFLDDVYLKGNLVAGVNGILASVQQPGYWRKVRVDNCVDGVIMKGQQYILENFESIGCDRALVLNEMSFLYAYGFNAEQCDKALYVASGGAANCLFDGVHIEMNNGSGKADTGSIAIDLDNSCQNMSFVNGSVSMSASGQTVLKCDTGSAVSSSYSLTDFRVSGGISSTGLVFVNDVDRSVSLDSWDDCRRSISSLVAPILPTSQTYTDPYPNIVLRTGGGYIAFGGQVNSQPSIHTRPGSSQTGDQFTARDTSGNRVSGFNKAGVFFTEQNVAPADADLVAGALMIWFDDTNGAAKVKFKAKQADGTVRTGEVALS